MAAGVNAGPLLDYKDEIYSDKTASKEIDHTISIIGWGYD